MRDARLFSFGRKEGRKRGFHRSHSSGQKELEEVCPRLGGADLELERERLFDQSFP